MVGQSGPLILDNHLQPVWFNPVPEDVVASNLTAQTYEGKPVLAWWQGVITSAGISESGEYVIVDQHYKQVARLRAKDGWILTLHSLVIDGDHAWVTANKNVALDLSKYGGSYNGTVIDSAVQEYDLRSGKLLRTWSALDHIPLADSYDAAAAQRLPVGRLPHQLDQLAGDGKFLVSMRDTWAAYLVDVDSGRIEWTLGGKHSTFEFDREARFEWQHDVTLHAGLGRHAVRRPLLPGQRRGHVRCRRRRRRAGSCSSSTRARKRVTLAVASTGTSTSFDARYMGNAQPLAERQRVRRLGLGAVLLGVRASPASC